MFYSSALPFLPVSRSSLVHYELENPCAGTVGMNIQVNLFRGYPYEKTYENGTRYTACKVQSTLPHASFLLRHIRDFLKKIYSKVMYAKGFDTLIIIVC
jgi:hypothetical protein